MAAPAPVRWWLLRITADPARVRFGLADRFTEVRARSWMLRAVGQGASGLECRADDAETRPLVEALNAPPAWQRVGAERAMLYALGGGCLVPIGVTSKV